MDKKEKIECLMNAGFNLNESKVLYWLLKNERGVTRKMEHDEDLRQPEVSVVVSKFEKKGWITCIDVSNGGRGRPQKEYSVNDKMSIFDDIVLDLESKQSEINDIIEKLREKW